MTAITCSLLVVTSSETTNCRPGSFLDCFSFPALSIRDKTLIDKARKEKNKINIPRLVVATIFPNGTILEKGEDFAVYIFILC